MWQIKWLKMLINCTKSNKHQLTIDKWIYRFFTSFFLLHMCVAFCTHIRYGIGTETVNLPELLLSFVSFHSKNKRTNRHTVHTTLTNNKTSISNKRSAFIVYCGIILQTNEVQRPINLQKLRSRSHAQHKTHGTHTHTNNKTPKHQTPHTFERKLCFISGVSLTFCCWSQRTLISIFCNEWNTFRNVITTLVVRFIARSFFSRKLYF